MVRKNDLAFILFLILLFSPFFIFPSVLNFYEYFNREFGLITSFLKFAVLATIGESFGLRIKTGVYINKQFGLIPRAVIWGFLGMSIYVAFIIFSEGTPYFLEKMGFQMLNESATFIQKLLTASAISTCMNLIFGPVMMTLHRITDIHIFDNEGSYKALITKIQFQQILEKIDWNVQWNFVIKKTIPFFWIPAHTITFLLPSQYRILFAAFLGIVLGLLLSIASNWNSNIVKTK